jgi:hypothetical protein
VNMSNNMRKTVIPFICCLLLGIDLPMFGLFQ